MKTPQEINSFFEVSELFTATYYSDKDIIIHQGGTSSGKTYMLMQLCLLHCIEEPNITVTVVGQDVPNLKSGAMKDLRTILGRDKHLEQYIRSVNNTDRIYRFHNGSELEFKSYENEQDARSGKRDYAFFNEANGISYQIYEQIAIRTKKKVYIDFNPSSEFWAHTMVWKPKLVDNDGNPILDESGREIREIPKDKNGKETVELIKSNWRHNPFLPQEVIDRIERKKNIDPEWYKVYGLGEMGVIEGLVYKRVKTIPEWPVKLLENAKISYGMDFGYSDDPTTLVRTAVVGNDLYVDELIYSYRLKLDKMAELVKFATNDGLMPVWADIEPRTIDELKDRGCNIRSVYKKNKDIKSGIELINSYDNIYVTMRSHNMRREFQNYKYPKKKNGIADENDDKPIDSHNHCFVGDTMIMTTKGEVPIRKIKKGDIVMTSQGEKKVLLKHNNGFKTVFKFTFEFKDGTKSTLFCTQNHKIYCFDIFRMDDDWKEAYKIRKGDILMCYGTDIVGKEVVSVEMVLEGDDKVYDLTVEDAHEYYANGILVHNCMDAMRYARMQDKYVGEMRVFTFDIDF